MFRGPDWPKAITVQHKASGINVVAFHPSHDTIRSQILFSRSYQYFEDVIGEFRECATDGGSQEQRPMVCIAMSYASEKYICMRGQSEPKSGDMLTTILDRNQYGHDIKVRSVAED